MTEKTFITFSDYKKKYFTQSKPHEQTDDEMIAMCKLLNAAFGGEVVEA